MIEAIALDPELCKRYDLQPTRLGKLAEIVTITGPSGGGKTRLFKLLCEQWDHIGAIFNDISTQAHAAGLPAHGLLGGPTLEQLMERGGTGLRARIDDLDRMVQLRGGIETALRRGGLPRMVRFFSDWSHDEAFGEHHRKNVRSSALHTVHAAALVGAMSEDPDWKASHPDISTHAEAFRRAVAEDFGVDYGWAHGPGHRIFATFDGRKVVDHELSEGQRIGLRWEEIVHYEANDLRGSLVLIDEPELYFHPPLLKALKRLRDLEPAQLWIAVRSLPLLPPISEDCIFEVRGGRVQWAGHDIPRVMKAVLGDEVERLQDYFSGSDAIAFLRFVAQCLLAPAPIPLRNPDDPQAKQLVSHVREFLASGVETHVLDFAAGSGRLVESIAAVPPEQRTSLRYHVFCSPSHTTPEERLACHQQLARLHPDLDLAELYHENLHELQHPGAIKMHAVVLCNVLHEIPACEWPSLMNDIQGCLRPDGILIVLEDQRMSLGELPHDQGYLVLDEADLRALFNDHTREIHFARVLDDRLSMAQVPAFFLERCTTSTVRNALESLRSRSLKGVAELRRPTANVAKPEHRRGREHAYFTILHTNATLALAELGG
jgi:SAM-dependent methyltransferase